MDRPSPGPRFRSSTYPPACDGRSPSGASQGEANRPLYGTFTAGTPNPARLTGLGPVVRLSDASGNRAWTISAQLRTHGGGPVEAGALYTYTRALDRMSLAHVDAQAMLSGTVLDGTLAALTLSSSAVTWVAPSPEAG